jgi:hypothetical protein
MATLIDTTPGGTARGRVGSREVRWDWTDAGSFLKWLQRECPISEKPAVQQPPFGCRVCRRNGRSLQGENGFEGPSANRLCRFLSCYPDQTNETAAE